MSQGKAQVETVQRVVERHALAARDLVASFVHGWGRANPAVIERIEAAILSGASWQIETRLPPDSLPSVSIDLVTVDGARTHVADLAFDAPAAVN